jgi:hypothetical protein
VNFPVNKEGKKVPFNQPEFLSEDDLFLWRDHLIESFRERDENEAPYDRSFRFLDMKGREPTLTLPSMGTAEHSKKKPAAKRKGKRASTPKIKAQVKAQKKKKKKSKAEVDSESEYSSTSEAEGDGEQEAEERDYEELDPGEVPPKLEQKSRPKARPARKAAADGQTSLSAQVMQEAEQEQAEHDAKAKAAHRRRALQDAPPPCPGNGPQKKEFEGMRPLKGADGEPVLFLTRTSMRNGTLPLDWRSPNWDPETVSCYTFLSSAMSCPSSDCLSCVRSCHSELRRLTGFEPNLHN